MRIETWGNNRVFRWSCSGGDARLGTGKSGEDSSSGDAQTGTIRWSDFG